MNFIEKLKQALNLTDELYQEMIIPSSSLEIENPDNFINIDIATIDEALNHKIPHHALIDVYVKKDFRNINLANKKVIYFVFGNSSN